jgi:diguanylate cyclase (GGDEF)-like protein
MNRYITKPLIFLTSAIENIDSTNLKLDLSFSGQNEIGKLTRTFNRMSAKLQENLVSKEYLENVLDSAGDIIIITDHKFEILQINKYGRFLLGKENHMTSNQSIDVLLFDEIMAKKIRTELEEETTVIDLELVLCGKNEELIDILSTWSTLWKEDGSVQGYVCNAKNVTLTKEIIKELNKKNSELLSNEQSLLDKSNKDYLTGMYNRRYTLNKLEEIIKNVSDQEKFCVLMMDIDYFKRINDTYGHLAGDKVLVKLTKVMKNALRNSDLLCRYGGEEFLIVLPNTIIEVGVNVAERIRKEVQNTKFLEQEVNITISGGLVEWSDEGIEKLIEKADRQLYYSKNNGRNKISTVKRSLLG